MNNDSICLNVGGKMFATTRPILKFLSFFDGIIGDNSSSITTPHFIDRDPKIFRHILKLLTNPDYNYPEKYISELKHYGFNIGEIKNKSRVNLPKTNKNLFIADVNTHVDALSVQDMIKYNSTDATENANARESTNASESASASANERMNIFARAHHRHTPFDSLRNINTIFEGANWIHPITGDFVLVTAHVLIPEYFSNKLCNFNITLTIDKMKFSFRLDILKYLQKNKIIDGFLCINIWDIFFRKQPLYIYGDHTEDSISFKLEYNHDLSISATTFSFETILRIKVANAEPAERTRFYRLRSYCAYLLSSFNSYKITNGKMFLPIGFIDFVVCTDVTYDYISIKYVRDDKTIDAQKSFIISKFDAKFEAISEFIPSNFTTINFRLNNDIFATQPCGELQSDGRFLLEFLSNDESCNDLDCGTNCKNGTIWIRKYAILKIETETCYEKRYCICAQETNITPANITPTNITPANCNASVALKKIDLLIRNMYASHGLLQ